MSGENEGRKRVRDHRLFAGTIRFGDTQEAFHSPCKARVRPRLLPGIRWAASQFRKNPAGFHSLNGSRWRQDALNLRRVDDLDLRNLPGRHVRGAADVTAIDRIFQVRMRRGNGRCGNAEHRDDRKEYRNRPKCV